MKSEEDLRREIGGEMKKIMGEENFLFRNRRDISQKKLVILSL
jgi:hypothetical protein